MFSEVKKNMVLLVLSTTVALLIGEFTLRLFNIGYSESPLDFHPVYHHVLPAEYRYISYTPNNEFGGHEVYYNKDRLMSDPSANAVNRSNSNCRVVFLGDSFTEARQVAYKDSFVGILAQHSDCQIINFGVTSYSPIFYLLQWRTLVKHYKPTLVIAQLYSNDISSDETFNKTAKRNKDNQIIAIPGEGGFIKRQLRKSYLLRFLRKVQLQLLWMYKDESKDQNIVAGMVEENPDIIPLSRDSIDSLSKEVGTSGAQFLLTVVPSKFRTLHPDSNYLESDPQFSDKWKLIAQERNIPFLDLTKAFEKEAKNGYKLFFDIDIHFDKNGHQVVASELSKAYPSLFKGVKIQLKNIKEIANKPKNKNH